MNITMIVGNIGGDAELKFTPDGTAVCNFSVATNEVWYTGEGENRVKNERVTWFRCAIWRKFAETMAQYLTKGTKVACSGEVSVRVYMNAAGEPAASLNLTVAKLELLGNKKDANEGQASPPSDEFTPPPAASDKDDIPF